MLAFKPLGPGTWKAFQALFGARGACGGCWCMYWRLAPKQFAAQKGEGNRSAMKALVDAGAEPGIIAFDGDEPVGWCAVAPRADYPALARSRVMRPVDDRPVWSVACLFVHRAHRKRGVATALLSAAVDFARDRGANILEGYPVEPKDGHIPPAFAWTGIPQAFSRAGFEEVARRSPRRPLMRRTLRDKVAEE
jgi:GNAT superfamily N-acetyltransferase